MNSRIAGLMATIAAVLAGACAAPQPVKPVVPALDYSNRLRAQYAAAEGGQSSHGRIMRIGDAAAAESQPFSSGPQAGGPEQRAQPRLMAAGMPLVRLAAGTAETSLLDASVQESADSGVAPSFTEYRSTESNIRDYTGPLSVGDPGVSASLWRESRAGNDLFRDDRAFQPMDLITIVISESAEGKKEADTEVKQKSSVSATIDNLLGLETALPKRNENIDLANAIKASMQNDYKGEGDTSRKDTLKARMSAMVVEVLPSGIIRIEGQKIVSVNSEEQIMVISGLVRPRDVNSANEVDSSKIANMRIDYYGSGILAEAQHGAWGSRLLRWIWPF